MPRPEDDYALELMIARREEERAKGFAEGQEEIRRVVATMVLAQLRRLLRTVPETLGARVETLSFDQLERLAEKVFDFRAPSDLECWLDKHAENVHDARSGAF